MSTNLPTGTTTQDEILNAYDQLDPARREWLEAFPRQLLSQHAAKA